MRTKLRIEMLVIDPQRDFCDPHGSLFVPGADADMDRLAAFIDRMRSRLTDIHVTLDSHRLVDISHPIWFTGPDGKHPDPFTEITPDDMRSGKWRTTNPRDQARTLAYLDALTATKRYKHRIWPPHCLIGTEGHSVVPKVSQAMRAWEERYAQVDYVTKGSNPYTEHFSGVRAEVPDPEDPSTQINTGLLDTIGRSDVVLTGGEALSHCQRSPRADNLLVRVISFNDQVHELHGFKPLPECKGYDGCIDTRGGTAVFDATANLIDSLAGYSETLVASEFGVNGIIFVVTDGEDNASQMGRGAVSEQQRLLDGARAVRARLQKTMKAERLESLVTILVGVNVQDPTVAKYLETFHREAGFSQYVEIKDASPRSLAKLADFTSRSVSAQSQALNSGGPSKALTF